MTATRQVDFVKYPHDPRAHRGLDRRGDGAGGEGRVWAGDHRCLALPSDVASAQQTCTPKGRCKAGWIVTNAGRDSWDVWRDVHTGEGRVRRQVD